MVDVKKKDGYVHVSITGNMEINSALATEETVNEHISNGEKHFVFDMGGVTYLSSSGIRVLVSTLRQVKDIAGRLAVFNPSEIVLRTLKIVEMDGLFYITTSLDDAIGSFDIG